MRVEVTLEQQIFPYLSFVEQLSLIQQRFQQDQLLYQLARIFVTKPLVLVVVVDEVVAEDSSTF
jgi:hypothetical protein